MNFLAWIVFYSGLVITIKIESVWKLKPIPDFLVGLAGIVLLFVGLDSLT